MIDASPVQALAVIDTVSEELRKLPDEVHDALLALTSLRGGFVAAETRIGQLTEENKNLSLQLLGAQVRLEQDANELRERYEDQIAALQTEADRLQLLLDEAKSEELWITERVAETLGVQATNMRDLTEKIVILIVEAKRMVQENL